MDMIAGDRDLPGGAMILRREGIFSARIYCDISGVQDSTAAENVCRRQTYMEKKAWFSLIL